jgi:hypothetical protein
MGSSVRGPTDHLAAALQHLPGEEASLYALSQLNLVLGRQQRYLADLAQVDPDQVRDS